MDRGLMRGNKICAKREEQRRHDLHRDRIKKMKPQVNTDEPAVWAMDHVRINLKREQMLEERYSEIDRENRILLDKMSSIMRENKTTPRSVGSTPREPVVVREPPKGPVSLNKDFRKKELIRITKENQSILKRIQQAQPIYNHVQWEGEHKKQHQYLQNCCEYPLVLKSARGQPSSELVPLDAEEGVQDEHAQTAPAAPDAGSKFILKEGQRIGEKYYLVEMTTDGRTLVIGAYDGESQQTLELVVKEKHHRRLYRESNGDYAVIASKLRIEGEQLVIPGLEDKAVQELPPIAQATPRSKSPPAKEDDPMNRTSSTIGADELVVRHEKPGSVGSVAVELGLSDGAGELEARVRLRGLTPATPPSMRSTRENWNFQASG